MGLLVENNLRLKPLDEYLLLGNNVYQIYDYSPRGKVFVHDGKVIWYDPALDGPTVDWEQLEASRPEVLI